ncbi:superinfection immunity protein [Streptomyces sp. H27-C3]|uniref:superinfection immunity protein n=1 Tax=Streptomyces sp. H27-C3 TaxID=3046305 RepID=UPI0024BBE51C|nr:superinfection immunity protein [Streptomyces sp. H27-C3]MDJ0466455.1 superinfection immunity protein [Streptomyces sp. H27-C3]
MDSLFTVLLAVVFAVIYLLPSYMAFARGAKDRWLILIINVAFGASLIGWGIALYMATRTPKRAQPPAQ